MVRMWLTVLMGAYPGLGVGAWPAARLRKTGRARGGSRVRWPGRNARDVPQRLVNRVSSARSGTLALGVRDVTYVLQAAGMRGKASAGRLLH
jgi:hypothetical protein